MLLNRINIIIKIDTTCSSESICPLDCSSYIYHSWDIKLFCFQSYAHIRIKTNKHFPKKLGNIKLNDNSSPDIIELQIFVSVKYEAILSKHSKLENQKHELCP